MKRNENLVPLSRDHHFGLLCSWKIREGVKNEVCYERIKNYINYFWEHHLRNHFYIEDHVLPHLGEKDLERKMEDDHHQIEKLVEEINQSNEKNLLLNFADALLNHIRFEERTIFPKYESSLSKIELNEIGSKINEMYQANKDDYPDQFWRAS